MSALAGMIVGGFRYGKGVPKSPIQFIRPAGWTDRSSEFIENSLSLEIAPVFGSHCF